LIAWFWRAENIHAVTFKWITFGLLLAAVCLHEGVICVILAAPVVYLVGHGIAAIAAWEKKKAGALVVLPLALLAGTEGIAPQWRASPVQTVAVTRTVAVSPDEVAARIARGPDLATSRPWLLAEVPLPAHSAGTGLDVGDEWYFHFMGDS